MRDIDLTVKEHERFAGRSGLLGLSLLAAPMAWLPLLPAPGQQQGEPHSPEPAALPWEMENFICPGQASLVYFTSPGRADEGQC